MHLPPLVRRTVGLAAGIALLIVGPTGTAALAAGGPSVSDYTVEGTAVTLGGTDLGGVTGVQFDTTPAAAFKVVSNTEVDATAPTLPVGYHEIYLVTSSGRADTGFSYLQPPAAPEITSISPNHGSANGGTHVVVKGKNFTLIKNVAIDGPVKSFNVVSDTEIDLVTAAHKPGATKLSISNLGGTAQRPFSFDGVASSKILKIESAAPSYSYIGGNTTVTINGSGFYNVKAVKFGSYNAKSFNVVSDTQITAVSPQVASGGLTTLSVTTKAGTVSTPWTIRYVNPWITGISPSSVSTSGGKITINGSGFTGVTSVKVDHSYATIEVLQDKKIVVSVPSHSAGTAKVTVTNPAGTSNLGWVSYN